MSREPLPPALALRPRDAARLLGVSPRTLWGWTKDNAVPHVRVGRVVLYPAHELRAWLSAQAAATANGGAQ